VSAELRCTGTPVSWLRLEQHHAGELPAPERDDVTAHLATCEACAACFARIVEEATAPLPVLARPAASARPPARVFALRRVAAPLAAFAVAAGVLLALGRGPRPDPQPHDFPVDPGAARTKGGDVGFVLVREDEGVVAEAGGVYREGDRWKAVVTCPAGMRASWDLVVYEHGEASFPLDPASELVCGNDVPLRGAFRTTGRERMTVCLVWDDGASVDREALRRAAPESLRAASCKVLDPAP